MSEHQSDPDSSVQTQDDVTMTGLSRGKKAPKVQSLIRPHSTTSLHADVKGLFEGRVPENKKVVDVIMSPPVRQGGTSLWVCQLCEKKIIGSLGRAMSHILQVPKNCKDSTG